MNDDRSFAIDRAFVFTDAATGALLLFYNGTLLLIPHDGMVGALFVTDQADFILVVSDAAGFVDMGHSHLNKALFFDGKNADGLGGADFSTKIAELFTITNTRHQPGSVKASKASLQEGRLKGVIGANLQTLPAPCTGRNEFFLWKSPWRADESVILQSAFRLEGVSLDSQGR